MGRKPKAGGAEGRRTDPAQSERFLKAARRVGVDETGEAFEKAFAKVARTKADATRKRRPSTGDGGPDEEG